MGKRLVSRAKSRYGELKRRKIRPPLDQLFLSMLWRFSSTRRAARILKALQRQFVDWNEVRVSPVVEIASAMPISPWATACAERMIAALQSLFDLRNLVSLDFLSELTAPQAKALLQCLTAVGRDLADEVLLFSLQASVFPLSEDTARMCYRLGLIRSDRPILENQRNLMTLLDPDLYVPLALFFVDTARPICRPDGPRCKECPMKRNCPKEGL